MNTSIGKHPEENDRVYKNGLVYHLLRFAKGRDDFSIALGRGRGNRQAALTKETELPRINSKKINKDVIGSAERQVITSKK